MGYIYAVFTSRSETLSFAAYLKRMGVPNMVVSTPKSAGRACGISVRFMKDYLPIVKSQFPESSFKTFKGYIEG